MIRAARRKPRDAEVLTGLRESVERLAEKVEELTPSPVPRLLPRDKVAEMLGIDARTLDSLARRAAEGGVEPARIDVGGGNRTRWMWRVDRLSAWIQEVSRWQASASGSRATRSAGRSTKADAASSAAGAARRRKPRRNSSAKSSTRSPSGASGSEPSDLSPSQFAKLLISQD